MVAHAKRRLTTILAADVEGYSRLMRADEEATLATLKAYRVIIDGLIARHDGRIFNTGGDSVLAEFGSAVEAVHAAISIQEELRVRNAEAAEERRMNFRIGINVGDVMVEDDNLFGDGINVAARLEGLAEPGGICISGSAYEQVETKLTTGFQDIGPQEVKNIDKPVSAFRLVLGSGGAPGGRRTLGTRQSGVAGLKSPAFIAAAAVIVALIGAVAWQATREPVQDVAEPAIPVSQKPSIAALAFDNLTGDPSQEYFSDGLTEDIITELSRSNDLLVIARSSSFSYKGKNIDVQEVAQELSVQYLLEGSVRRTGDQLRVTAQLIDGIGGSHMWAETYDRQMADVFEVQRDVVQNIVGVLLNEVRAAEMAAAFSKPTANLRAYDYVMLGDMHLDQRRFVPRRGTRAMELALLAGDAFETAVELDPDYAEAYLGLSTVASSTMPQRVDGQINEKRTERQLELTAKAIRLNPNLAAAYRLRANALRFAGRVEEGLALVRA